MSERPDFFRKIESLLTGDRGFRVPSPVLSRRLGCDNPNAIRDVFRLNYKTMKRLDPVIYYVPVKGQGRQYMVSEKQAYALLFEVKTEIATGVGSLIIEISRLLSPAVQQSLDDLVAEVLPTLPSKAVH